MQVRGKLRKLVRDAVKMGLDVRDAGHGGLALYDGPRRIATISKTPRDETHHVRQVRQRIRRAMRSK